MAFRDGGAKWGSRNYYLFHPKSGRFITNALTAELGRVQENGIVLDAKAHEIQADLIGPGDCPGGTDIYRVENGLLIKVQEMKVTPENGHCIRKVKKLVNGEWKVVKAKKEPDLDVGNGN